MDTQLVTLLQKKLAQEDDDQVLQAMGYSPRRRARARARLRTLLNDPWLGLAKADYDFRFSSREFVTALIGVVGLDANRVEAKLKRIEKSIAWERSAFKPWIFVETRFQRSSEPILALAAMEGRRRLALSSHLWFLPRARIVAAAIERVRVHYRECEGSLPCWGAVNEYWLILSENEQVAMDTSGRIIRVEPPHQAHRTYRGMG